MPWWGVVLIVWGSAFLCVVVLFVWATWQIERRDKRRVVALAALELIERSCGQPIVAATDVAEAYEMRRRLNYHELVAHRGLGRAS